MEEKQIKKRKFGTIDYAYIGIFAALISVCAWITIPFGAVPFTLQTFAVFTAAALLGTKRGTLSIIIYMLIGLIGVPVFSNFGAGAGVLFGVTGGYLIGFIFTSLVIGTMVKLLGKKAWVYMLSIIIGMIVYYTFGTAWFIFVYSKKVEAIGLSGALSMCVIPFIIPDLIKAGTATLLCTRLKKHIK